MATGNFLNGPGEEECVEDFDEEKALLEGVGEEPIDGNSEEGETDLATPLLSLKEQLRMLATAKRILFSSNGTKYTMLRALADVQASLRRDLAASSQQTLIKHCFTSDQSTRVL